MWFFNVFYFCRKMEFTINWIETKYITGLQKYFQESIREHFLNPRARAHTSKLTVRPSVSAVMINGGLHSRNLFALPLDGDPNGDQHAYFTRREAIHLSQNLAPGRWDKGPREKGGRETEPIQFKYLGEKSKCLAKHLLSKRIKLFPLALWSHSSDVALI